MMVVVWIFESLLVDARIALPSFEGVLKSKVSKIEFSALNYVIVACVNVPVGEYLVCPSMS